jgi:hypothetical protein
VVEYPARYLYPLGSLDSLLLLAFWNELRLPATLLLCEAKKQVDVVRSKEEEASESPQSKSA